MRKQAKNPFLTDFGGAATLGAGVAVGAAAASVAMQKIGEARKKERGKGKGKDNPNRPPKKWMERVRGEFEAEYPKRRGESQSEYDEEINRIIAGVWYRQFSEVVREKLTREFEQRNKGGKGGKTMRKSNPIPNAFEAGDVVSLEKAVSFKHGGVSKEFPKGTSATVVAQPLKGKVVVNVKGWVGGVPIGDVVLVSPRGSAAGKPLIPAGKITTRPPDPPGESRFKQWTKILTGLDANQVGGFMYLGAFVRDRKADYKIGTLFLSYGEAGSRAHHPANAIIYELQADGHFEKLASAQGRDWALDLRKQAAQLLEERGLKIVAQKNPKKGNPVTHTANGRPITGDEREYVFTTGGGAVLRNPKKSSNPFKEPYAIYSDGSGLYSNGGPRGVVGGRMEGALANPDSPFFEANQSGLYCPSCNSPFEDGVYGVGECSGCGAMVEVHEG